MKLLTFKPVLAGMVVGLSLVAAGCTYEEMHRGGVGAVGGAVVGGILGGGDGAAAGAIIGGLGGAATAHDRYTHYAYPRGPVGYYPRYGYGYYPARPPVRYYGSYGYY